MKTILKCKFACDSCGTEEAEQHLPYGWYTITSKATGFEFNLCRACVVETHRHFSDIISDFPVPEGD